MQIVILLFWYSFGMVTNSLLDFFLIYSYFYDFSWKWIFNATYNIVSIRTFERLGKFHVSTRKSDSCLCFQYETCSIKLEEMAEEIFLKKLGQFRVVCCHNSQELRAKFLTAFIRTVNFEKKKIKYWKWNNLMKVLSMNSTKHWLTSKNFNLDDPMTQKGLLSAFSKSRGFPQYWKSVKYSLRSHVAHYGPPTWFLTLNPNTKGWTDLHELYSTIINEEINAENIDQAIARDPEIFSRYWQARIETFWKEVIMAKEGGPLGEVTHFFRRVEYQHRGTEHLHCVLWMKNKQNVNTDCDIDRKDSQNFLELLYGQSSIDDESLNGILKLAEKYEAKLAIQKWEMFLIDESEKTLKEKLEIAKQYKFINLKNECLSKIKNVKDIRSVLSHDLEEMDQSGLLQKSLELHKFE